MASTLVDLNNACAGILSSRYCAVEYRKLQKQDAPQLAGAEQRRRNFPYEDMAQSADQDATKE
jgi:hypothetical protein